MNLATMISLVMLPVLLNLSSGCKPRNPSSGLQGTRVPYAAQQFQNMGVIHIVETDLLLDDLAALEVMAATIMKESKGQNVIIITADDETKLKAGAAYQYLSMFGKDQVIVIPGPVVASLHPFDYLETYRDDKHKKYLETLAGTEYASHINPTNSYDLFEAIKQSKARVRVYSLANPIGINTYVMGTLKDQIDTVYSMGMYRVSGTNATSGYNANINLEEQLKFLQSVQSNNIEVIHLPSSLFYQKEDKIIENTANARKKMRLPNNPTIQKLDKSLLDFQNLFAGESIRKLGVKDPWAMLFDAKQAWPQDLYTFASSLLLREELTLQKVKIELPVPGNYNPKNLGIAVTRSTVVNDDPGRFYEVTTLNLPALTKKLLEAYNGGTAAMPVRNPESYFQKSENVALLITKASIDDMALVRTLITKRQLGLVYTESVDAGNSAEIFQKILTAYGAKVPVIGGSGAMKSGITNLKAEEYLFATGYGKQILGRKAAADHSDASNPKNAAEIAKFINNASKKVDIFITTSVTDFNEALKQVSNPQQRIGVVHIMGGARGDGNLTRNWLLNPMATQNVLQTLNQA
ncbi:MAG: nucleoside hydrolase, partial [Proteobacteria bacterium]|nr:nucleoside hydrolase [Pseudomonadota bacterium]